MEIFERSPEWELKGFKELVRLNPSRYSLNYSSFWEGMIYEINLMDNKDKTKIGNTIIQNNVSQRFAFKKDD